MLKNYSKKIDFNIDIENILIDNKTNNVLNKEIFLDFLKINQKDFKFIDDRYQKLFLQLNNKIINKQIIGKKNYYNYLLDLKSSINYCTSNINSYYFELLQKRKELTNLITSLNNLDIPIYDHITHKTGRVKIIDGYNFLTSTKKDKFKFKNTIDHILLEIDFKSAEPSLLYSLLNKNVKGDLYKQLNIPIERKKAKLAVISTIYGSGHDTVKKLTGISKNDYERIKNIFKVDQIKSYLEQEYKENGYIHNLYGRHIYGKTNLVNYWLQSSAADFAISSFYNFFQQENFNIKAIIHDAIILECKLKDYAHIKKINYLTDPITNISIPIDKTIISK